MAGYNSKFTGQQVDSLLEKAGSSYQKPETGIPQSDLAESTQQILQNVENKVNKEKGKGLSTNDFTDEYKAKVEDSASQEGYFPKMSVGIAANLAGRGEATEQVFTYRPTDGGTSIESGVAKIRRVKGNSVVWNQILVPRNSTETSNGITATQDGTGKVVVKGTATATAGVAVGTAQIITGHKYVYFGLIGGGANKFYWSDQTASVDTGKGCIAQPTYATGNRYFVLNVLQGITVDFTFYPQVCDLTQMFGAGNEPDTVEEFRALYPDSYYPYNAGELRNLVCNGIKTVGFNQWDEQWENGYIVSTTGQSVPSTNVICSKNFIPVVPNKTYYFKTPSSNHSHVYEYDKDFLFIGVIWSKGNNIFTTSPNSKYIKITVGSTDAPFSTYNNDICINLHHTGWRDGEYEPYKEVTHSLPLSQITNGEPLRKAGSVYDEINETEYIRRVGVVDLGSYDWYETPNGTFKTVVNIPDIKAVESESNYTCEKYIGVGDPSKIFTGTADNLTISTNAAGCIYIRDDAYKTGTALKASLSGVLLNYELAEPIVTPIETSLNLDYQAEDFGTEEALLTDNSAPFSADIVYQFNAVDRIRANSLDIEDLLARVIALENAAAATTSIPDIPDITE